MAETPTDILNHWQAVREQLLAFCRWLAKEEIDRKPHTGTLSNDLIETVKSFDRAMSRHLEKKMGNRTRDVSRF